MTLKYRLWIVAGFAAAMLLGSAVPAAARRTVAQKRQIARTQFDTAERLRAQLEAKPEKSRSKKDYTRVLDAYRKVYYTAPTSSKADAAAMIVGELMADYGSLFNDDKSSHDAIAQYEFLRREYPGSKRRFEALFNEGQIYQANLGDSKQAKQIYEEFLKRYPRNEFADQARDAVKEIDAEAKGIKPATKRSARNKTAEVPPLVAEEKPDKKTASRPTKTSSDDDDTATASSSAAIPVSSITTQQHRGKLPLVTNVRYWSTPDYTRVAIDLEEEVKYEAGRVPSPDRIFFDLHDTKLASELMGKSFDVGDGFLHKIRIAQFEKGMTRVVLEVDDVAEYSAFLLPNPYRLIIDIHGKAQTKTTLAKNTPPTPLKNAAEPARQPSSTPERSRQTPPVVAANNPPSSPTATPKRETEEGDAAEHAPERPAENSATKRSDPTKELTDPAAKTEVASKEVKATSQPTSAPISETVAPRKGSKKAKKITDTEDTAATTRTAEPTASGDRSLIRALGLKIGKIVVDAGHGGHDTGTIGPKGLMEKDLVLDVALRLGKLLEKQLGAEVVYTRDDDTFIPLETRTAIANKQEADLFISVHANSSRDSSARGVETYYLNFTSNADALEVAARENAVSQKSVFELQDLVKKIALKEKIEESREFATDVQHAMSTGLSTKNQAMRDRGVKKAPFVVLIGANMPSILAEISFVSNPGDEKKLETPDYRQKIAESLFKGVSRYASGLSGIKVAGKLPDSPSPAQPGQTNQP